MKKTVNKRQVEKPDVILAKNLEARINQCRSLLAGMQADKQAEDKLISDLGPSRVERFRSLCELAEQHAAAGIKDGLGKWIVQTIPDGDSSKDSVARFNGYYGRALTIAKALVGKPESLCKVAEGIVRANGWKSILAVARQDHSLKKFLASKTTRKSKAGESRELLRVEGAKINLADSPVQFLVGIRTMIEKAISQKIAIASMPILGMVKQEISKLVDTLARFEGALPDGSGFAPTEVESEPVVARKGKPLPPRSPFKAKAQQKAKPIGTLGPVPAQVQ